MICGMAVNTLSDMSKIAAMIAVEVVSF